MKWIMLTWAVIAAIPIWPRCGSRSATFMQCQLRWLHFGSHRHVLGPDPQHPKPVTWFWTREKPHVAKAEIK